MKRWRTRNWRTAAIVALALAILIVGSLLLKWIGLDPNAFAAVASALAAVAAFASARESSSTARDAVRALSLTSKPEPSINLGGRLDGSVANVMVLNYSPHPIIRGTLRWKLKDGTRGSMGIDRVPGAGIETALRLDGAPRPMRTFDLNPAPTHTDLVAEVNLDYWGANGPIGWRHTARFEDGRRTASSDTDLELD